MTAVHRAVTPPIHLQNNTHSIGPGTVVAFVALATLAGLAYWLYQLYQKHLVLSERAQAIRDSFRHPQQDLSEWDMINLAKQIESLQSRRHEQNQRYQIKFFPSSSTLLQKAKKFIIDIGQNTCRVQRITKFLGRGGFGKVVQLADLQSGGQTALKIATPPKQYKRHRTYRNFRQESENDLKKEHQNLIRAHTPTLQPGVQDRPLSNILTIVKLYEPQTVKQYLAYEGTLYEGSLDKFKPSKYPIVVRLFIAFQVLQGMEGLRAKKLISHDLKPENILYRRLESGQLEAHVSDLGGVTHESELGKEPNKGGLAHTEGYSDTAQLQAATALPFGFLQRTAARNSEECTIGLTLFFILTGQKATVNTDENTLKRMWLQAKLPLQSGYEQLFSSLKSYSETGFLNGLFKNNLSDLRQLVEGLYQRAASLKTL